MRDAAYSITYVAGIKDTYSENPRLLLQPSSIARAALLRFVKITMATPVLPPNPCLLGILLVAKFDSDAQVVFHYPPRPGDDDSTFSKYFVRSLEDGSTSSSDDEGSSSSDDQDRILVPNPKPEEDDKPQEPEVDETGSASPEKRDGMTTPQRHSRWDDLFGYNSALLAKLLCPAASSHKKKFEVALDDKVFLGRPIFAKEGGQWRRRRRRPRTGNGNVDKGSDSTDRKTPLQAAEGLIEMSGAEAEVDRPMHVHAEAADEAPDNVTVDSLQAACQTKEHMESMVKDELSMFHMVFILNPPPLEYHLRIKEMYDNVVKKLSRAMKWEQARSSYVSEEATIIAGSTKKYFKTNKSLGKPHTLSEKPP